MTIKNALKVISVRFLDLYGRHGDIIHIICRVLTNHDN